MNKRQLGQFYTTNFDYILENIDIENFKDRIFIEPFAGNNDLIKWIEKKQDVKIQKFDIDPKDDDTIKQNTLLNPPNYMNKVVITNPPYLAKNKSKSGNNKILFEKYNQSDLYRIFIYQLIQGKCYGGVIIIPLNFFSSLRKQDIKLRSYFLQKYDINQLNIFEERVFSDTSYTVCSFKFIRSDTEKKSKKVKTTFYPKNEHEILLFEDKNDYLIGGDIYKFGEKEKKYFLIDRLTKSNKINYITTNIFADLLDSGTDNGRIKLKYKKKQYIGNQSDRVFATIIIKPLRDIDKYQKFLSIKENQIKIIDEFNKILNKYREKYHSLFLSNYRESSNGNGRKRCSFGLCYGLIRHILYKIQN